MLNIKDMIYNKIIINTKHGIICEHKENNLNIIWLNSFRIIDSFITDNIDDDINNSFWDICYE